MALRLTRIRAPTICKTFPSSLSAAEGSTIISGSFNSTPNVSFTLDFFSSPAADPTNNGEGQTFLCEALVATDASGVAVVNVECPATTPGGYVVTATATRNAAPFDTSEFSNAVMVSAPTVMTVSDFSGKVQGDGVRLEWLTTNELDLVGFNLWRQRGKGEPEQINAEFILAQKPGRFEGAAYGLTTSTSGRAKNTRIGSRSSKRMVQARRPSQLWSRSPRMPTRAPRNPSHYSWCHRKTGKRLTRNRSPSIGGMGAARRVTHSCSRKMTGMVKSSNK